MNDKFKEGFEKGAELAGVLGLGALATAPLTVPLGIMAVDKLNEEGHNTAAKVVGATGGGVLGGITGGAMGLIQALKNRNRLSQAAPLLGLIGGTLGGAATGVALAND